MIGNIKAKISCIKDLKVIFFYKLDNKFNSFLKTDLLGLKIVYGNNETLNLDYTSPYFQDFIFKVISTYTREKDDNNIILLNELTENLLKTEDIIELDNDCCFYQDKAIFELKNRNIEVVKSYVKDIVISLMNLIYKEDEEDENFKILNITGYRNKYYIEGEINSRNILIPLLIKSCGSKKYIFKIGSIGDKPIIINGSININAGVISIDWNVNNSQLVCQEVYKYNGLHERSTYSFEEIIDFDNEVEMIDSNDKEIIDNYFKILGLENVNKGVKISDNRFLLGLGEDKSKKNEVATDVTAHVLLKDDSLDIIYSKKYIQLKNNQTLIVPIAEELENITVIPMNIDNDNYLLVQRCYDSTNIMRGDYYRKVDKNNYQVFKVNKIDSLKDFKGILEEYEIRENMISMNDIKKYIKKGGEL